MNKGFKFMVPGINKLQLFINIVQADFITWIIMFFSGKCIANPEIKVSFIQQKLYINNRIPDIFTGTMLECIFYDREQNERYNIQIFINSMFKIDYQTFIIS